MWNSGVPNNSNYDDFTIFEKIKQGRHCVYVNCELVYAMPRYSGGTDNEFLYIANSKDIFEYFDETNKDTSDNHDGSLGQYTSK